jgi:hypothetical protein
MSVDDPPPDLTTPLTPGEGGAASVQIEGRCLLERRDGEVRPNLRNLRITCKDGLVLDKVARWAPITFRLRA